MRINYVNSYCNFNKQNRYNSKLNFKSRKQNDTNLNEKILKTASGALIAYLLFEAVTPYSGKKEFDDFKKEVEKEQLEKPVVKNAPDDYLYERFFHKNRATNTYYHLNMAQQVDEAKIEKIDDNEFSVKLRLDEYEISGKMKFQNIENDTIITGAAVKKDIYAILSKSKEYRYEIHISQKGSKSFELKILPQSKNEKLFEYKLTRDIDGKLALQTHEGAVVLNSEAAAKFEKLNEDLKTVGKIDDHCEKSKELKRMLQLFLILYFGFKTVENYHESMQKRD